LKSINFISDQIGWIIVSGGLLKTSDAGNTWTKIYDSSNTFKSIFFNDTLKAWALSFEGKVMRSTNGGSTWQPQNFDPDIVFNSVFFSDLQTGWLVGSNGTILKTSNGGQSWQNQNSGINEYLKSVHFTDTLNGWVVVSGFNGAILHTTNGGNSWIAQKTGSSEPIFSIYFTDPQNGWVAGRSGTILHTSTSGITPTHKTIVSVPTFSLYPNPAEEYFQIDSKSPILSASIIDGTGREIEIKLPGDGKFPLHGLGGRLYWVKIQTKDGVAVQKLVKK